MTILFCFGLGYAATAVARDVMRAGGQVVGTHRTLHRGTIPRGTTPLGTIDRAYDNRDTLSDTGSTRHRRSTSLQRLAFDGTEPLSDPTALQQATHVLISVPPDDRGCPVLTHAANLLAESRRCRWVGYFSTTGVYGDHGGNWVDEITAPTPNHPRAIRRLTAEQSWQAFGRDTAIPVSILRLGGIYGPGRSAFDRIKAADARRIDAPGRCFSRIHVDDIAAAVLALMTGKHLPLCDGDGIINLVDDEPAAQRAVLEEAARLLDIPPPPLVPLSEASLSPMGRSFWADKKRVRNTRLRALLAAPLHHPTYREGLRAIAVQTGLIAPGETGAIRN